MKPITPSRLAAILTCLTLLPPVAPAQNASVDERLQRLEDEVKALRQENQQLRAEFGVAPKPSAVSFAPAGHEVSLTVGGMIQAQADFGDKGDARFASANDRFYLRRARINLQGKLLPEVEFRLEGEFAGSLGEGSGNRAQLTDGYINWSRYDFANVRLGQFKTPFGFEQLASDSGLFTIERSLPNDRLTVSRQIGAQIAGRVLDRRLSYATGIFNGTGVNTSANDNDAFMWAGRVSAVAWRGKAGGQPAQLALGADAYATTDRNLTGQPGEFGFDATPGGTKDNTFTGHRMAGGLDAQFRLGGFDLWAEYLRARFEPTDAIPLRRFDADGWYLLAGYFILPKQLQAVVKYERFDPNLAFAANRTATWTIGANWYFQSDDLKLQLDYLISDLDSLATQNRKLLMRLQTLF